MSLDTASAKALLQSDDLAELQKQATALASYSSDDPAQEQQYLKLQILLWNRILQLVPPEQHATTMAATGRVWMRMGETEKAAGQLKKALELQSTGLESVPIYQTAGDVAVADGNYTLAVEYHQHAVTELESNGGSISNKADLAMAYSMTAAVYETQGSFDEALKWLEKAQGACANIDDGQVREETLATVKSSIGTLQEKLGEYEIAVAVLKEAHALLVKTRGDDDSRTQEIGFLLDMASQFVE